LHSQLFKDSTGIGNDVVLVFTQKVPGSISNVLSPDTDPADDSSHKQPFNSHASARAANLFRPQKMPAAINPGDPPVCW
jgi:hypothetical protein